MSDSEQTDSVSLRQHSLRALEIDSVAIQWGIRIALRDDVQLSATAYLPSNGQPAPAILTLTPYIAQRWHDQAMYFAARGFPFVVVDVRGRGNSAGDFHPLINEAHDACDVIEWLARQPYCNGNVTMWGGSYGGHVQWAAARECPPRLATIVPVASPYVGLDFPRRGHSFKTYVMQWLALVWGHTSQDNLFSSREFWAEKFRRWFEAGAPFKELDAHLGLPSPVFQEWIAHPEWDEYWQRYNPAPEQYARISIPILTITGSCDGDQPGALRHYREHLKHAGAHLRHYLIIGPWDHAGTREPRSKFSGIECGPESLVDLQELHLQWYRWTMQGGPKPEFLRKPVAYYVMGAEQWRYAETLEAITTQTDRLYLHSSGNPVDVFHSGWLTADEPVRSAPDSYVYDPRDISLAELESTVDPENRTDQRLVLAAGATQLVYHSAPFERATEISGFFKLIVWLSIDQRDTDFRASVYEIAVDGRSILLSSDAIRARYREDERAAKLIETTDPLRYEFDRFMFVSRRLEKNHRLRLVIGPVNSIYWQKNYNSGGVVAEESISDARTVTVKLFHDAEHPSALYVPLGQR